LKQQKYLIVGQGLAGSLVAWHCLRNGCNIKVVDSSQKLKASKVAAGIYQPLVFKNLHTTWNFDVYYNAMILVFSELELHFKTQLLFRIDASKVLENDYDLWQQKSSSMLQYYSLENDAELRQTKAALFQNGYVNLPLFLRLIRNELIDRCMLIDECLDYSSIQIRGKGAVYKDEYFDGIIFCEGTGVTHNPWFHCAGFAFNKGEIIEIYAPKLQSNQLLRGDSIFVLPMVNDYYKVGATYNRDDLSERVTEEGISWLTTRLDKIIKVPYQITSQIAGIRPATRDRRPVIGPHPEFNQLMIFNGLGSKGVLQAPYWSQILVKTLVDGELNLSREVDVKRFGRFINHSIS